MKIGAGVLTVYRRKEEPKKLANLLDAHFRIFGRGAKGCNHIVIKFCTEVEVLEIITHANLDDDQFRRFRGSGGRITFIMNE